MPVLALIFWKPTFCLGRGRLLIYISGLSYTLFFPEGKINGQKGKSENLSTRLYEKCAKCFCLLLHNSFLGLKRTNQLLMFVGWLIFSFCVYPVIFHFWHFKIPFIEKSKNFHASILFVNAIICIKPAHLNSLFIYIINMT